MATDTLEETLQTTPQAFLTPSLSLHDAALGFVSSTLGPVAADIRNLHLRRTTAHREERRQKRKRDDVAEGGIKRTLRSWDEGHALRLAAVHTKGFGVEQVWEQVKRVVEGVQGEVERDLALLEDSDVLHRASQSDEEAQLSSDEIGEHTDDSDLGEEGVDYEVEGVDDDEDARPSEDEDEDDDEEDETDGLDKDQEALADDMDSDDNLSDTENDSPKKRKQEPGHSDEYIKDPNGLNDGFFSIDEFNKQADFLERADMRGEDDGAASDEEDVDWEADPLNGQSTADTKRPRQREERDEDEESDDDDSGPTFGNMDLDAPDGASDDDADLEGGELDDLDDGTNANSIMYADFFAPPAKRASKKKKGRPHTSQFPAPAQTEKQSDDEEQDEAFNEGALSRIHRELFSDESDQGEEDEGSDADGSADDRPGRQNLSTHEKNQLALQKQIRALEATLVSAKPWALSGEASSSSRPLNSLLEEDLAFERAGKPIPIVTAEVSSSLEELIRSRIVAQDFQDVPRRRPDDLATGGGASRRSAPELDDTKSKRSLAQLYEDEHARATTGATDADRQLSEKQATEQAEITALWADVRSQLDSLSNFSLRPRAPTASLEIRADVPVARLEDARPAVAAAAGDGMGGVETSALAPGEVHRVGGTVVDRDAGERLVGGRKGLVVARDEMGREDGKRARRRAKDRARKSAGGGGGGVRAAGGGGSGADKAGAGKKRDSQKEVLGTLEKGGVKVIGRKGEVTDVRGRKVDERSNGPVGAGSYKL